MKKLLLIVLTLVIAGCSNEKFSKDQIYGINPKKDNYSNVQSKLGRPDFVWEEKNLSFYMKDALVVNSDRLGNINSIWISCQPYYFHVAKIDRRRSQTEYHQGNDVCKNLTRNDIESRFGKPDSGGGSYVEYNGEYNKLKIYYEDNDKVSSIGF